MPSGGLILGREPVVVLAVVNTTIGLLAVLWPDRLDPSVQAAIIGLANAILALLARSSVTPVGAPVLADDTLVTTPTGDASVVRPQWS